jgi:6-hydroxycyclohex-1-ene-1-carbonyl-CoA dehydrogenase
VNSSSRRAEVIAMKSRAWVLVEGGKPLEARTTDVPAPAAGEVVVEVDACGLCHTDLGYADGSVAPKHALPLVLGHEIVGKVVQVGAGAESWAGRSVIVPAVLPCGECAFCRAGRGNACPKQKMPGNDCDGGFATYCLVPARPLVSIDDAPAHVDRRELGVVADAVSTAYQALKRAEVREGDVVFVVGAGGVGGYAVQIARAMGAHVVALDVDAGKLEAISRHGAERTVLTRDRAPKDVRKEAHGIANEWRVPSLRWRTLECSGHPDGQTLAYALLSQGSTLVQVGYTPSTVNLRLSNVMAFDATLHGSWGCPPELYGDVLRLIYGGQVVLTPFVEHAPMSRVVEHLDAMAHHKLTKRLVLDPRA